jgi:hypothetical protein
MVIIKYCNGSLIPRDIRIRLTKAAIKRALDQPIKKIMAANDKLTKPSKAMSSQALVKAKSTIYCYSIKGNKRCDLTPLLALPQVVFDGLYSRLLRFE